MTAQENVTKPKEKQSITEPMEMVVVPEPTKVILSWLAPTRPFKKRDREYYTTIGAIVFLVAVILMFLKEWLLIAVVVSLVFVAYVLATVAPEEIKYEITNKGLRVGERLYIWEWLGRFWFTKKMEEVLVNIETRLAFPGRLILVLRNYGEEEIKKTLSKYLVMEKPEDTWMDRTSKWLQKKIPMEG